MELIPSIKQTNIEAVCVKAFPGGGKTFLANAPR